jgi:hypothetical protein
MGQEAIYCKIQAIAEKALCGYLATTPDWEKKRAGTARCSPARNL